MKRNNFIVLASVIAMIAVVYLHANGIFWSYSSDPHWMFGNAIECIGYFAVPVFFMITGANLLDYPDRYDTKTYFKKRVQKTVIPYLFWGTGYLVYQLFFTSAYEGETLNFLFFYKKIILGEAVSVYWFFLSLFHVYVAIPLLAYIPKKKKKELFTLYAVLYFGLNVFLPFVSNHFFGQDLTPIQVIGFNSYVFFAVVGYLITKEEMKPIYRMGIYGLGILGFCLHYFGTASLTKEAGEVISTYKGYGNLPSVLYSVGVFVFIKYGVEKFMKKENKVISFLSGYTYAVYLLHIFFLHFFERHQIVSIVSYRYRLGIPWLVIALCIGVTWLIRKIPLGNRILP